MQSLEDFYRFMQQLQTARRDFAASCLAAITDAQDIAVLENALHAIDKLPGSGDKRMLEVGGEPTPVVLDYERRELERDIVFLDRTTQEFFQHLGTDHTGFSSAVEDCTRFLRNRSYASFITDRDGTVNNYCGHYRSSHQPVYNAVVLSRFVSHVAGASVILTSAPLEPHGIIDLTTMPERTVTLAGSKGREYLAVDGRRGHKEVPQEQQSALEELNGRIDALLRDPAHAPFALIGSGVQYKFGQTTVARQDIHDSITQEQSERFLETVTSVVRDVDPDGTTFAIEDTGKDIEIMLTVGGSREFSKGDGVAFLAQEVPIDFTLAGTHLVCGDTHSDVPMVEAVCERAGQSRTATVFVTTDEELKRRVTATSTDCFFVDSPDVLITALNRVSTGMPQ